MLIFFCRQVAKAVSCTMLEKIENLTSDYDVIGIDEGQFVSRPLRCFIFIKHFFIKSLINRVEQFKTDFISFLV